MDPTFRGRGAGAMGSHDAETTAARAAGHLTNPNHLVRTPYSAKAPCDAGSKPLGTMFRRLEVRRDITYSFLWPFFEHVLHVFK